MNEPPLGSRHAPLLVRVAATFGLALTLPLGQRVMAPGVDPYAAAKLEVSRELVSIFALGVKPMIAAYFMVEVAALVVPRWRGLRHAWPKGRAKLERSASLLSVLLAAFQAYGAARFFDSESLVTEAHAPLLFALSLIAGTALLLLVARAISRLGIANGLIVLVLAAELEPTYEAWAEWQSQVDASRLLNESIPLLVALGALGLVSWLTLKSSVRESQKSDAGLWVPVPASTFQPISISSSLLMMPVVLANFGISEAGQFASLLELPRIRTFIPLLLTLVVGLALSFLLNRPELVARLNGKVLHPGSAEAEARLLERAPRTLRKTLLPTALFLASWVFAAATGRELGVPIVSLVPPLVALALDFGTSLRAHAARPDLVCIWEERRPYAVPMIRQALERTGIRSIVLELNQAIAFQFFAPYVAARICVSAADARRGRALLRSRLLDGRTADTQSAPPPAAGLEPEPATTRRTQLLGLAVAVTVACWSFARPAPAPSPQRLVPPGVSLEVIRVDDVVNPFASVVLETLPEGAAVMPESIAIGGGRFANGQFVRIVPLAGEPFVRAAQRVEPWLRGLQLPPDTRLALGRYDEWEPASARYVQVALRTYLLRGPPIVTGWQVRDAEVQVDRKQDSASVLVSLTADGAVRFRDATREHVGQRLAIVIDGRIETAPKVEREIDGGYVTITMAGGDLEARRADAERLAAALVALPADARAE